MIRSLYSLLPARSHALNQVLSHARLSFSTRNMSRTHNDNVNTEDKAKLDAHFEKVAQTYEQDGRGVQNALCRSLL